MYYRKNKHFTYLIIHSPKANNVFNLGLAFFRFFILSYNPTFPSLLSSFDSNEDKRPFFNHPKANMT